MNPPLLAMAAILIFESDLAAAMNFIGAGAEIPSFTSRS